MELQQSIWIFSCILIVSISSVCGKSCDQTCTCDPTTDCGVVGVGGAVPDPENCHGYYGCIDPDGDGTATPTPTATVCDNSTLYFDPSDGACKENLDGCFLDCSSGGGSTCNLTCRGTYDLVPDITDCRKYYICEPEGQKAGVYCPTEKPYFDGTVCTADQSTCCNFCGDPKCDTPGTCIPDLTDCSAYYYCDTALTPYHFPCAEGTYFNQEKCTCDGTVCVQADCGSGGTSTTVGSTSEEPTTISTASCSTTFDCTDLPDGTYSCTRCDTCINEHYRCFSGVTSIDVCHYQQVFNCNPDNPICLSPADHNDDDCPYDIYP